MCLLTTMLVDVLVDVLRAHRAQPRVPPDTRGSLPYGLALAAPRDPDLLVHRPSTPRAYRTAPPFHGHGCPAGAWGSAMILQGQAPSAKAWRAPTRPREPGHVGH